MAGSLSNFNLIELGHLAGAILLEQLFINNEDVWIKLLLLVEAAYGSDEVQDRLRGGLNSCEDVLEILMESSLLLLGSSGGEASVISWNGA
jgi:hypothetical protein